MNENIKRSKAIAAPSQVNKHQTIVMLNVKQKKAHTYTHTYIPHRHTRTRNNTPSVNSSKERK